MPTIPQQQTIVQYVANASQTQYTFSFYAFNQANINVYYQAANATPVPAADILTLGAQYTVTFNSDPTTGGYITLLFTPTSGFYLTIALNLIPTLNTNFANAQNFNGANLDAALDYLLMLCQQNLNYALNRNLSYVINTYLPNAVPFTQLPPLPQNYVWVGSSSGVVAAQIATVPSASILQSLLANNSPSTDGARLVGYYDATTSTPTTVQAFLASINNQFIGASLVGSTQALTAGGVPTLLNFTTVQFDPQSISAGHNKFTPLLVGGGFAIFTLMITLQPGNNSNRAVALALYKNGSSFQNICIQQLPTTGDDINLVGSFIAAFNGTSDYFQAYATNFGVNGLTVQGDAYFQMTVL